MTAETEFAETEFQSPGYILFHAPDSMTAKMSMDMIIEQKWPLNDKS
jgi:hypothetical protein